MSSHGRPPITETPAPLSHPGDDALSAYLDRALDPRQQTFIGEHLTVCAACARDLAELRAVRELVGSLTPVPLPRSFALTPTMLAERLPTPLPLRLLPRLRMLTAVAAVFLLITLMPDLWGLLPRPGAPALPTSAPAAESAAKPSVAPILAETATPTEAPKVAAPAKAAEQAKAATTLAPLPTPAAAAAPAGEAKPAAYSTRPAAAAEATKPSPAATAAPAAPAAASSDQAKAERAVTTGAGPATPASTAAGASPALQAAETAPPTPTTPPTATPAPTPVVAPARMSDTGDWPLVRWLQVGLAVICLALLSAVLLVPRVIRPR